jgi:putative DNA primase/helicase
MSENRLKRITTRVIPEKSPGENGHPDIDRKDPTPSPKIPFWEFPTTDLGAADYFANSHEGDVRYVHGIGWMVWDGAGWQEDGEGDVARRFSDLARAALREAAGIENEQLRASAARQALRLQSAATAKNAIGLAQNFPAISTKVAELNSDPFLLGTPNGQVNLLTGKFHAGNRSSLITRRVTAPFDPGATCPRWRRFISEVAQEDPDLVRYLHKAVGYSFTGSMADQIFFFLFGGGSNGKSVFVETLQRLAGNYSMKASASLLLVEANVRASDPKNELAELPGVRFLSGPEVKQHSRLNEGVVKDITGGDSLRGEAKYERGFRFIPACKLWFFGNHKPAISGTDHGIWRRVRMIPFEARFEGKTRDSRLQETLHREMPGILNWIIAGAQLWRAEGLNDSPACVTLATADYRATEDVLGIFIHECLEEGTGFMIRKKVVFDSYQRWAVAQGLRTPMTAIQLTKQLKARGFHDGEGSDYWRGWTLRSGNDAGLTA